MSLQNSVFTFATITITVLTCTIPIAVPALGAEVKQNSAVGEAKGCKDLREGMMALIRSRRELNEANERVQGDDNRKAVQAILYKTGESIQQTDSLMDRLQCTKGASSLHPAS